MDRQLVVLRSKKGILDCFLRPSKDFTEVQYSLSMVSVKPAVLAGFFLWGKAYQGRCAVLLGQADKPTASVVVHTSASDGTSLASSASVLRLAYKLHGLLRARGITARVIMPPDLLQRRLFHMHLPLVLLSDATEALNLLDSQGIEFLSLPPALKPGSKWGRIYHELDMVSHHTRYLVRSLDFKQSFFCQGSAQLHESISHFPLLLRGGAGPGVKAVPSAEARPCLCCGSMPSFM